MGFSDKQLKVLRRNLDHRYVRSRTVNGRQLSYIEGWYAISQANRIFGFDAWSRETVESRCVLSRENRGAFLAVYTAKVRITVEADGMKIIREGHGSGEGRANSPGEVHDTALKAAETDATKRALATFGRPFGLELYRKDVVSRPDMAHPSPPLAPSGQEQRLGLHPDDTTPIPRPSHYYGRRHRSTSKDFFPNNMARNRSEKRGSPRRSSRRRRRPEAKQIDKSQLAIAEPKSLRDKAHLKLVASQPCLVCGRQPIRSPPSPVCAAAGDRAQGE